MSKRVSSVLAVIMALAMLLTSITGVMSVFAQDEEKHMEECTHDGCGHGELWAESLPYEIEEVIASIRIVKDEPTYFAVIANSKELYKINLGYFFNKKLQFQDNSLSKVQLISVQFLRMKRKKLPAEQDSSFPAQTAIRYMNMMRRQIQIF